MCKYFYTAVCLPTSLQYKLPFLLFAPTRLRQIPFVFLLTSYKWWYYSYQVSYQKKQRNQVSRRQHMTGNNWQVDQMHSKNLKSVNRGITNSCRRALALNVVYFCFFSSLLWIKTLRVVILPAWPMLKRILQYTAANACLRLSYIWISGALFPFQRVSARSCEP